MPKSLLLIRVRLLLLDVPCPAAVGLSVSDALGIAVGLAAGTEVGFALGDSTFFLRLLPGQSGHFFCSEFTAGSTTMREPSGTEASSLRVT